MVDGVHYVNFFCSLQSRTELEMIPQIDILLVVTSHLLRSGE